MASCSGCKSEWTSLSAAHCGSCHRTFSGITVFDTHRFGGRCTIPEGITKQSGVWSTEEGHQARKTRADLMAVARAAKGNNS